MERIVRNVRKGMGYLCMGLSLVCVGVVIVKLAWWHLFSALVFYLIYCMLCSDEDWE